MAARRIALALLTLTFAFAAHAKTAAELQLALRKLNVVGSALYVAAHPDDENTAMLSWLASDRLVRAGYLSLTRGDGGQNLLGDEKGPLLGVIRTEELLAARKIDGAEQMFTRAIDFGFTKSPDETLTIWDRNAVLADVVWAIRKFQPDVIITRFPTTGEGGHGQHTASAILAQEAFRAAADPTRFPEQLKYVRPWQAKRIFWNRFSFQRSDPNAADVEGALKVDIGAYNPLLGRSYTEIAAESRSQHKSQGFGSAERRGSVVNYLKLTDGEPAKADPFEGIDLTWSRYPGGEAVGRLLQKAVSEFDPSTPQKSIPLLLDAYAELDRLGASNAWAPQANPWIEVKRRELLDAISGCAGLSIDVAAADSAVTPGGSVNVGVTVVNRSDFPFYLSMVASPYAAPSVAPGTALKNNQPVKTDITIKLPDDYPLSQPYWLRKPPAHELYTVDDQKLIGRPENGPAIPLIVSVTDNLTHTLIFTLPAIYRWTDAVLGEQTRDVDVVPAITANLSEQVYLLPESRPKQVAVKLRNFNGATDASVSLALPAGWQATPSSVPVTFTAKAAEAEARFTVTPPAGESSGAVAANVALPDGKVVSQQITTIDYPHIPAQRIFSPAQATLQRIDLKRRGQRIGYIMGAGDDVDDFLRQAGYDVTLLTDEDLDAGNFAKYDAIVTGVRAYNSRTKMRTAHSRLMKYVENGGTLVVQYNSTSPQPLLVDPPGPYPFKVSRSRVTVEEAPVTIVNPGSPLLNEPNKVTAADFNGWVQERGLYFTSDWDPKYQTVIASHDPGESDNAGGEIYARYGKGLFIYTSYAWFRQLPAGVPGAYRLFLNLVSAR